MKKFMISRTAIALRFMVNKLHLSSIKSFAQKTCSLLLIMFFGLTQLPIQSEAKTLRKARLVFDTSYLQLVNQGTGFSNPEGIGTAKGKSTRNLPEGDAVYAWSFPQTISPEGAEAQIGLAAKAKETGSGMSAVMSCIGIATCSEISVIAKPGEGKKEARGSFKIVPQPAYETQVVYFTIRLHGGFDVVFRYRVEQ